MADLSTLKGISDARTALFNRVESGEVPEQRANIMERILRGQTTLKGELPLKFIKSVAAYKGGKLEGYIAASVGDLAEFLQGEPKALTG